MWRFILLNNQSKRTTTNLEVIFGTSWESLLSKIPREILARLETQALLDPQSQLIALFSINLLLRMYPAVTHVYLEMAEDIPLSAPISRWKSSSFLSSIEALYKALNPPVVLQINGKPSGNKPASHLSFGNMPPIETPGVWVGCDNWIASLSSRGPLPVSTDINPIGAYAAATLSVSETWKRVLLPLREKLKGILISPLDGTHHFSTFDYTCDNDGPNPHIPDGVDIHRLTIVGLGAGGGAAVYTLSSLPTLKGLINVIELDEINDSNLNRYIFADDNDAKKQRPKVDIAAEIFSSISTVTINALHIPFQDAIKELDKADYEYVLSAVDNRKTRKDIQFETPKILWDAGATETGDFFIWRMILRETECMFCKHPSDEVDIEKHKAEQLSELLGLNPEIWFKKITENEAFDKTEIETIKSELNNKDSDIELPIVEQRFSDWEASQCGRLTLPEIEGEIPISFAPVMAGILLAGEIIKEHHYNDNVLKSYYWNSLTARFNPNIIPQIRMPLAECTFCHDEPFLQQYDRMWIDND